MQQATKINWTDFKAAVDNLKLQVKFLELSDRVLFWGVDDPVVVHCAIPNSGSEFDEFDTTYRSVWNLNLSRNVITAAEVDNKNLRTMAGFADTDSNGEAEIVIPIPSNGRWLAYGDAEFDTRHMGDYVKTIEVEDIDRLLAWQLALMANPSATSPLSDAAVQAATEYDLYPIMGHFDERDIDQGNTNIVGTLVGGMTMTFQYGITEAQPVGGYAFLPGGMYFRIVGKKASGHTTGFKFAVSLDWAEPK
jgi:hypothetical protein